MRWFCKSFKISIGMLKSRAQYDIGCCVEVQGIEKEFNRGTVLTPFCWEGTPMVILKMVSFFSLLGNRNWYPFWLIDYSITLYLSFLYYFLTLMMYTVYLLGPLSVETYATQWLWLDFYPIVLNYHISFCDAFSSYLSRATVYLVRLLLARDYVI